MTLSRKQIRGFTLIEIMAAVVVLGLLTGAAVLAFGQPIRNAEMKLAIQMIRDADRNARTFARTFDRTASLSIDFNDNSIAQPTSTLSLPGSVRIDEIRIAPNQRMFDRANLIYSSIGLGRSYAVHLKSADESTWLVFSGLSGQMMQVSDDATADKLLQRH